MQLLRTERFKKDFKRLPSEIQERVGTTLERFVDNPRHPSLHAKKMEGAPNIWELRVTDNYRITFQYENGDSIQLRKIGTHDILRNP